MKSSLTLVLVWLLVAPRLLFAADAAVPAGVLNLNATASVEVAKDVLHVAFSVSREGADATAVQNALKQALDVALTEAKKVARPGQLDVQTGNFFLHPRYSSKGQTSGWQGSAELLVEGKDMTAIAQLTGRINSMTIARVSYGLSREARDKVDGELTAQAVARFRARAAEYAKHFGYASYTVREVQVAANEPPMHPLPMARAQSMAVTDEALPVQVGRAQVAVTVSGSVQMLK